MAQHNRSPFMINVVDLARRPGEMRELEIDVTVQERMGNAVIGIAPDTEMQLDVRLESLHDGILVTADVDAVASGECVRCLTEVTQPVEVEIQEVFAYDKDEAFEYQVQDDHVDLEPVIRDAVVLSLPFQPVCREDCLGLCPQCGVRLLDNPGHEHEEPIDPRWAKLAGLEGLTEAPTDDALGDRSNDGADREKR
ncbi:YceD family protein [Salinibacterium sp. SYSU T00001]|uniref:YceD family protein n=1 Tax=Homoserinimonas sedimenticola TaxID=2986805 RepID=UPI002235F3CC|nr:YceD family protein [Salinibacterium sedimenticola]MCW4384885.1 YceD family protein [Salinibacterium sedimenticola]